MGSILSQVNDKPSIRPPRILIHGKGGVGKTTFGASAPNVVLLPVEDGEGVLQVPHLPRPRSFEDVLNTLGELYNEEHPYKTLVIDAIDKIEPLIWEKVCADGNKPDIEAFGYGKGYKIADGPWIKFFKWLDALRSKGITVVVLAHNHTKSLDDPLIGAHVRTDLKLHDRAVALSHEWADVVGCLDIERVAIDRGEKGRETRTATTSGQRVLYLEDTGALAAKNRYSLPTKIYIPKEAGYQVLRAEILKALTPTEPPTKAKKAAKPAVKEAA